MTHAPAIDPAALPEPEALPEHPDPPDPLRTFAGEPIASVAQWREHRRPELQALFQRYVYGPLPPEPTEPPTVRELVCDDTYLAGRAELRELELHITEPASVSLRVVVVVPRQRAAPVPTFLAMNRYGNHSVLAHPGIALPPGWVPPVDRTVKNHDHQARDADRGNCTSAWPVQTIIERGYGFATFYPGDVVPDDKQFCFEHRDARGESTRCATIAAWAWGARRALDALAGAPGVDADRVALFGHSRRGKTAMLATAMDERFAMALPHQSGSVGTAPARTGRAMSPPETIKLVNDVRPHWFSDRFKRFNDQPQRLPVDQHCLIALAAPRPVLLSNAEFDPGANPLGTFRMARAAEPVYHLHGRSGLGDADGPGMDIVVGGELGYFLRAGEHSVTEQDWDAFLTFADRHLHRTG